MKLIVYLGDTREFVADPNQNMGINVTPHVHRAKVFDTKKQAYDWLSNKYDCLYITRRESVTILALVDN